MDLPMKKLGNTTWGVFEAYVVFFTDINGPLLFAKL